MTAILVTVLIIVFLLGAWVAQILFADTSCEYIATFKENE